MAKRTLFPHLRLTAVGGYWLLTVAGFLLTGLTKNVNLILVLGNFLAALLLLNAWVAWRSVRDAQVRSGAIAPGFAGEPLQWRARIAAERRVSGMRLIGRIANVPVERAIAPLDRSASTTVLQTIFPTMRGVHVVEPLVLEGGAPFGLVVARTWTAPFQSVTVYPRRGAIRLHQLVQRLRASSRSGQRRVAVRHLGEGTDIHGLRQFRTGDSPRWIHWKTTARVGKLMVREFDQAAGPSLSVAVDGASGDEIDREAALSFASTLIAAWGEGQDGKLALLLPRDATYELVDIQGRRQAADLLMRLADWPASTSAEAPPPPVNLLPEGRPVLHVTPGRTRLARFENTSARRPSLGQLDPTAPSDLYTPPSHDESS